MLVQIRCRAPLLALGLLAFAESVRGGTAEAVQFDSPCECNGNHGEYRWAAKTDPATPPPTLPAGHRLVPSDIGAWPGPGGKFHETTPRSGKETEWWEVTGRVTLVRAEADGDLHVQLADATGTNAVNVVVEIPLGQPWCPLREQVFSWVRIHLPISATSGRTLRLSRHPVVRVVGKAFYDAAHAGNNTLGNRRPKSLGKAPVTIWEIHPVMTLQVVSG